MRRRGILDPKKRYLQVALNSTLDEAVRIVRALPESDRILIEAGTPLIKRYGTEAVRRLHTAALSRGSLADLLARAIVSSPFSNVLDASTERTSTGSTGMTRSVPYIVADLKTMDRADTEVAMVAEAGASAAIALGVAPIETLNAFVAACEASGIDAMIDMMNVPFPLSVLRALKRQPHVVLIHRGVDEEHFNKEKQIPFHEIQRIKGSYDTLVSIAGGDTLREVQRAVFNDADIVVVWKSVYTKTDDTIGLVEGFLKEIS